MNTQFHTPSFGDELVYDVDGKAGAMDAITTNASNSNGSYMQATCMQQQTRRMRSLDQPLEQHYQNYQNLDVQHDDATDYATLGLPQTMAARKQMPDDIAEPPKPNSPYALFFRETVNAIKDQNPSCTYEEIANIVANMWDSLDSEQKNVYNKKTEHARKEYLVKMRAYRDKIQEMERQAALEQQQQQLVEQEMQHHHPLQTKPAVFTIPLSRTDNSSSVIMNNTLDGNMSHYNTYQQGNDMLQQQHQMSVMDLSSQQQLQSKPAVFTIPLSNENHYGNYNSNQMLPTHMQQQQQQQQLNSHHQDQQQQQQQQHVLLSQQALHQQQSLTQQQQHYQTPATQFLPQSDIYGESTPEEIEQRRLFMKPMETAQQQQEQQQQQLAMQYQEQQPSYSALTEQQHFQQLQQQEHQQQQQQQQQQMLQQQTYELQQQQQLQHDYQHVELQQQQQQLQHAQNMDQQQFDMTATQANNNINNNINNNVNNNNNNTIANATTTTAATVQATATTQDATSTLQMQIMQEVGAPQKCTRNGCNNLGVMNSDWEDEYCSNECVVAHCRDVFQQWVKDNNAERAAQQTQQQQQ